MDGSSNGLKKGWVHYNIRRYSQKVGGVGGLAGW